MTNKKEPIYIAFPDGYPEILEHMGQTIGRKLIEHGMAYDTVKVAAVDITEAIRTEIGGVQQYIPRGLNYMLSQRDIEIYEKFKGNNYDALAHEYQLTAMQIRNIIKRAQDRDKAARQGNLL